MNASRRFRHECRVRSSSSVLLADPVAVLAQQPDGPRPKPAERSMIEALPHQTAARTPASAVAPPPVTPPTILAVEAQPIDLTTALELANVQNPEFNVARTRILEAAAMRQLAAAYFLPSINPGLNYDSHTGNLQQSSGNILSVNRSAFYVGAGANAVAAGTVNIPGRVLQHQRRSRGFRLPRQQADGAPARVRVDRRAQPDVPPGHRGLQRATSS